MTLVSSLSLKTQYLLGIASHFYLLLKYPSGIFPSAFCCVLDNTALKVIPVNLMTSSYPPVLLEIGDRLFSYFLTYGQLIFLGEVAVIGASVNVKNKIIASFPLN